ncbi:GvpL/GvpF family gas vesicle protein [Streptomyces sp. 6N223]|uniref:GvpL/GvpF family gas vesicle protein n=1 Tax=Streptomyces sp. 6N223 TaxID=3457412 RepID=UPI003FD5D13F
MTQTHGQHGQRGQRGQPEPLWYVYAVTRAARPPLPEELRGVAGGVPLAVPHAGLAAVVSQVPAQNFAAGPLAAHLEDLAWLERTARAHQAVVDALLPGGCVLPLRLATVCQDEPGVRRLLAANRERFESAIGRLDGRAEWGVKVYADLPSPAAPPAEAAPGSGSGPVPGPGSGPGSGPGPGSGRDYLRRRRQERRAADAAWREAEDAARQVHATLVGAAERFRLRPPRDARLTGEPGHPVLNSAYLVPNERGREFAALAGRLAGRLSGQRISVTGPWAPYSFTTPEEDPP